MNNLEELVMKYGLTVRYFKEEKVKHIAGGCLTEEEIREYKEKGLYLGCDVYKRGLVLHHIKMEKPKPGYWGVKTGSWSKWEKNDYYAPTLKEALDKAIKGIREGRKRNKAQLLSRVGTNKI